MDKIVEFLPFLIPLIVAQLVLMLTALIHVIKHLHYKFGNKPLWIVIVIVVQMIGPIIYFVFGRGDES